MTAASQSASVLERLASIRQEGGDARRLVNENWDELLAAAVVQAEAARTRTVDALEAFLAAEAELGDAAGVFVTLTRIAPDRGNELQAIPQPEPVGPAVPRTRDQRSWGPPTPPLLTHTGFPVRDAVQIAPRHAQRLRDLVDGLRSARSRATDIWGATWPLPVPPAVNPDYAQNGEGA